MKRLIRKNAVKKIQNLDVNHDSQPIKLNLDDSCGNFKIFSCDFLHEANWNNFFYFI